MHNPDGTGILQSWQRSYTGLSQKLSSPGGKLQEALVDFSKTGFMFPERKGLLLIVTS